MALPKGNPNEALLQVNERDEKYFDIERLDITTMHADACVGKSGGLC